MTTRILPRDEWLRLGAETGVPAMAPYALNDEMTVVVEEDRGRIVACWAVLRVLHVEGLWIDPAYRKRPSVARKLLAATWRVVRQSTSNWVMTAAVSDDVRQLLVKHVGAVAVPGDMFVIPVNGVGVCRLQG